MITTNRLGKLAGPSGIFAGYILLVFGVIAAYFTYMAIPLILLGGIMAFSYSEADIDAGEKSYRLKLMLFGFLPLGSWKEFKPDDGIGVKHIRGNYYTLSRSGRQNAIPVDEYHIYLEEGGKEGKIILGKFQAENDAMEEARRLTGIIQSMKKA